MDATRAEDRGMIVETGVGANASFACGLASGTTCVFVTNPLISTTTEGKEGEDRSSEREKESLDRRPGLRATSKAYRELTNGSFVNFGSSQSLPQVVVLLVYGQDSQWRRRRLQPETHEPAAFALPRRVFDQHRPEVLGWFCYGH